jgi:hypothetical protein
MLPPSGQLISIRNFKAGVILAKDRCLDGGRILHHKLLMMVSVSTSLSD